MRDLCSGLPYARYEVTNGSKRPRRFDEWDQVLNIKYLKKMCGCDDCDEDEQRPLSDDDSDFDFEDFAEYNAAWDHVHGAGSAAALMSHWLNGMIDK